MSINSEYYNAKIKELKEETKIRCYRKCINNSFHKSNCGYCQLDEIVITNEGCMDFQEVNK